MKNNKGFVALIVIIALQLCSPLGTILASSIKDNNTKKHGEMYKIEIEKMDYDDGCLSVKIAANTLPYTVHADISVYATVQMQENGLARLYLSAEAQKPETDYYIEFDKNELHDGFPYNLQLKLSGYESSSYYNKRIYYSHLWGEQYSPYFDEGYVEVYIYKGKYAIGEIYVDGLPVENYLKNIENQA